VEKLKFAAWSGELFYARQRRAHLRLRGRDCCSAFGTRDVPGSGVLRSLALTKLRLTACKHAAMAIEHIRDQPEAAHKKVKLTGMEKRRLSAALINTASRLNPL
jgi:hypothetical protein